MPMTERDAVRPWCPGARDRRALSTVVNYTVMLVVVGILVSGLLVGVNGYVDGQNDRVLRSELAVVGNHLAADLTTADRLAGTLEAGDRVALDADLPARIAGETYLVSVSQVGTPGDDYRYELTLATDSPAVSVTVAVRTDHQVDTGRYAGGDLRVVSTGGTLEVRHD